MKILYVEIGTTGHHFPYVKSFVSNQSVEKLVILPKPIESLTVEQVIFNGKLDIATRKLFGYIKLLKAIKRVAEENKVDLIHFLYGDALYRFFGLGLFLLRKYKLVASFHSFSDGYLHKLSTRRIFRKIDYGIVHTEFVHHELESLGIKNSKHIYYPFFDKDIAIEKKFVLRSKLKLDENDIVISAIGGTRYDKGLDILLDALNDVSGSYRLIIAGLDTYFKRDFIEQKIVNYQDKVSLHLKYLTKEELLEFIEVSDAIIVPYRKVFNGASGPLTEGVWYKKTILGPNHGALGDTITKHSLGLTFEAEDPKDLAKMLNQYISSGFPWNKKADEYRHQLDPKHFIDQHTDLYKHLLDD